MKTKDFTGIKNNGPLPSPQDVTVGDDIGDMRQDYIESTNSILEELEHATLRYEARQDRDENAAMIKRLLHKLKGEAGMVGCEDINELCHQAESAFEELWENQRPDMLLRFKDWVDAAIDNLR